MLVAAAECAPQLEHWGIDPRLHSLVLDALLLVALLGQYCGCAPSDPLVFAGRGPNAPDNVRVSGTIEAYDFNAERTAAVGAPPVRVEHSIRRCSRLEHLLPESMPPRAWARASTIAEAAAAVRLAWARATGYTDLLSLANDAPMFTLRPEFMESARSNGFAKDEAKITRLIEHMVDALRQERMGQVHALRRGRGARTGQVRRGADRAWRRDIDYEYHLHYWTGPNIGVEFAKVAVHNDFQIPT